MRRKLHTDLLKWHQSQSKKPLILKGARQVGKTFLVNEFGKEHFKQVFEFNFEKDPAIKSIFKASLDANKIVDELSLKAGRQISSNDLIFFDEAQDCPRCLTSLKYFAEQRPHQPVIAAGSLLGLTLGESSFPVGKVEYLWLGPFSFEEFLEGIGDIMASEALKKALSEKYVSEYTHQHLWGRLKDFYVTGGMPSAIQKFKENSKELVIAYHAVRDVQYALIRDYQSDFSKHSGRVNAMHLRALFNNIPQQLSSYGEKSTNKFKFSMVDIDSAQNYTRLRTPIEWLERAGLVYKVKITNKAEQPLSAYSKENFFKLYPFDTGITAAQLNLPAERIVSQDYGIAKGYFAENLVLQGIVTDDLHIPYCWNERNSEIEFLVVKNGDIIPVEVKSGHSSKAKSLSSFIKQYSPKLALKFHAGRFGESKEHNLLTLPLYAAWDIDKL